MKKKTSCCSWSMWFCS